MAQDIIIRNATIVNEGKSFMSDLQIKDGIIYRIGTITESNGNTITIEGKGLHLLPGCIDDQVHFREPGLTHKGNIQSESRAAVAGGITSFMEMPNTVPQTITQERLEEKYAIASNNSPANYSFFMGVTNQNYDEVMRTPLDNVCGIKIFMGSSTGDMLVDNSSVLSKIFSSTPHLIAVHCEDERTILDNLVAAKQKYGEYIPIQMHPKIRSAEACYTSSSYAIDLAKKHNTRLHILHISTAKEIELFTNKIPLSEKRITAEACVHHLWFDDNDYEKLGAFIKWNPAVKSTADRQAIRQAINDGQIDIIATDHAPHTLEEKQQSYLKCPSGGPLVQHALPAMLELVKQGHFTIEKVVEKMAHAPADCFQINQRGYIREGYAADIVLVDLNSKWKVTEENILYHCKWSPFKNVEFSVQINTTIVNGQIVYQNNQLTGLIAGQRLEFNRR